MPTGLTIDDQDILSSELEGHGVQLFANVLAPGGGEAEVRYGKHRLCVRPTSSVGQA